ncbi:MAG: hypothetical protein M5U28_41435 [Sandaracinaceae bacterium]|nr:hypothetical protein [Sandaracinaceae bacterium]
MIGEVWVVGDPRAGLDALLAVLREHGLSAAGSRIRARRSTWPSASRPGSSSPTTRRRS